MRKRFLHNKYGENDRFWDGNWDASLNRDELPIRVDPRLLRAMLRHLPENALILEGGCGDCQYVRCFHKRGFKVIGVDFAAKTVGRANQLWPSLDVRMGDIRRFEFPDEYFDAYYSGGVIEHFEDGLIPQISEANRVLKAGGLFFVTVPHLNICRKLQATINSSCHKLDLDGRESFHRENVREFRCEQPPPDFHFHEYVLTSTEVRTYLSQADFHIIDEMAFSIRWGLLDLAWFRACLAPRKSSRNVVNKAFGAVLKIVDALESSEGVIHDKVGSLLGECVGNLKLYVCRKRG